MRNLGLSYIPEDRMTVGVAKDMDILTNLFANQYDKKEYSDRFFLNRKNMEKRAEQLIKDFPLKLVPINKK